MLKWNQAGLKFNGAGLKWNGDLPPSPSSGKKGKMAKVKLSLQNLTDDELLSLARAHISSMAGNANFTTPSPSAAAYLATTDAFEAKITAKDNAVAAAKQATLERDAARDAIEDSTRQRGTYVETTSVGDAIKITSSGFGMKAPAAPVGMPVQTEYLAPSIGDMEGEVDLTWDKVRGANSYMIQKSPDPITGTSWTMGGVSTKSSATLSGLTSGTKYWFRVAAIGAAGQGPWSDPATKMAP